MSAGSPGPVPGGYADLMNLGRMSESRMMNRMSFWIFASGRMH